MKRMLIKTILKKSNITEFTPPDLKIHYKTTEMNTVWYWPENSHSDQWNRIDSPKLSPRDVSIGQKCQNNSMENEGSFIRIRYPYEK